MPGPTCIIPTHYYRRSVDQNGLLEVFPDKLRIIDHADGTWFYGHDAYHEGGN